MNANDETLAYQWFAKSSNENRILALYPSVKNSETRKAMADWEKAHAFSWEDSELTQGLRHAIIPINESIELSVEVGGNPKNPAILLVMGLGSQMVFWPDDFIYQLIEAGYFVIRFDNRDIGLSSKSKTNSHVKVNRLHMMLKMQIGISNDNVPVIYTLKDMVEDTVKLIQALKLSRVSLIGASMGGIISQLLAYRYPEVVNKLILLFTTTNRAMLPPPKPKQLHTLFKKPASQEKSDAIAHGLWFIQTVGSPGYIDIDKTKRVAQIRYERCYYPFGTVQQLNAILSTGSISRYSRFIKAPTLVLSGSEDGLVPASHGKNIARTIPDAQFHLIEGMGHDLPDYYLPHLVRLITRHCQVNHI